MERIVEREVSMKILSFGSLNIDYVYKVPHFVKKGETLSAEELNVYTLNYNLRFWFAKLNSWESIWDKYKCYQLRF